MKGFLKVSGIFLILFGIQFSIDASGFISEWARADSMCQPLPTPSGNIINVSDESDLRYQVQNAVSGSTIQVATGFYNMQDYMHITVNDIAIRSVTGNRDDVVLDFGGMISGYFGILLDADDVTIADITIQNAHDHGVSVQGKDRPVLYNLHIIDINDQLVKVNPDGAGSFDGLLACSRIEYTTSAPNSYTNGISGHLAHDWIVRDNEWINIRGSGTGETGPAILFWSQSDGTIVERNLLINCYRGIAFGNAGQPGINHYGGIVRNNFIYAEQLHDVAMEMIRAEDWLVANNTALLLNPAFGLTWGMEARFSESMGTFAYNLTNMDIWEDRDGAQGSELGNEVNAQSTWFSDPASGNLHLLPSATGAIDLAGTLPEVTDDFDAEIRPYGSAPDIGADELASIIPATSIAGIIAICLLLSVIILRLKS